MNKADINTELQQRLKLSRPFICPKCSGFHFGTTLDRSLNITALHCHDQYVRGCKWRGQWKDVEVPNYCGDISLAWFVRESMFDDGFTFFCLKQVDDFSWRCQFSCSKGPCEKHGNPYFDSHGGFAEDCDTAEMAICLAALNALKGEE